MLLFKFLLVALAVIIELRSWELQECTVANNNKVCEKLEKHQKCNCIVLRKTDFSHKMYKSNQSKCTETYNKKEELQKN